MAFEPKLCSKPVMKINKEFYSKNKVVVRRLESYVKKIINKKWAVIFNRACVDKNLVPRYEVVLFIVVYLKIRKAKLLNKKTFLKNIFSTHLFNPAILSTQKTGGQRY